MIQSEADLRKANALVAMFYRKDGMYDRFAIQLELLTLGIKLDNPLQTPDPRAPAGGSAIAMKEAA